MLMPSITDLIFIVNSKKKEEEEIEKRKGSMN